MDRLLQEEPKPARPLRSPDSALEEGRRVDIGVEAADLSEGLTLVECFFLGLHEMEGRFVTNGVPYGRGCIDLPAGELWERTVCGAGKTAAVAAGGVEEAFHTVGPRYVKLVVRTATNTSSMLSSRDSSKVMCRVTSQGGERRVMHSVSDQTTSPYICNVSHFLDCHMDNLHTCGCGH